MKTITGVFAILVILAPLHVAASEDLQLVPPWPQRWFEAGIDFGSLKVEYRLTDDCNIDPDIEIVEQSQFEVTHEEILASLTRFLETNSRMDPPREVVYRAIDEVLDPDRDPEQPLTQGEYLALTAAVEEQGPWPEIRYAPVSSTVYRCTFDPSGALIRVEQLAPGEDEFTDFNGRLSELGPFIVRWYMEE